MAARMKDKLDQIVFDDTSREMRVVDVGWVFSHKVGKVKKMGVWVDEWAVFGTTKDDKRERVMLEASNMWKVVKLS